MIGWNHLVEIKRIEKLALIIFPPTHHARLPLMPIHQRNHGSRVVSTGVLQHYQRKTGSDRRIAKPTRLTPLADMVGARVGVCSWGSLRTSPPSVSPSLDARSRSAKRWRGTH